MMSRQRKSNLFVGAMSSGSRFLRDLAWLLGRPWSTASRSLEEVVHASSLVGAQGGRRPPAILATIYLAVLLLLMAVPIGVLTAIYLEEYARKERWYNRVLKLNIQNLAAVPAIVYGILGLAFVVRGPVGVGRVLPAGGDHPHPRRPAHRDHRLP